MRGPIGYCAECGAIFESSHFAMGNSRAITFMSVGVPCPQGHGARLLDGTFDFVDDAIHLVSGPEFTREVFERLLQVVAEANPETTTAGELATEASKIHPTLGSVIEKLSGGDRSKRGAQWLAAIAIGISLIAASCRVNLDVNRLIDQIRGSSPSEGQAARPHEVKDHESKQPARPNPPKKRP
jgi:hypothetical protein